MKGELFPYILTSGQRYGSTPDIRSVYTPEPGRIVDGFNEHRQVEKDTVAVLVRTHDLQYFRAVLIRKRLDEKCLVSYRIICQSGNEILGPPRAVFDRKGYGIPVRITENCGQVELIGFILRHVELRGGVVLYKRGSREIEILPRRGVREPHVRRP